MEPAPATSSTNLETGTAPTPRRDRGASSRHADSSTHPPAPRPSELTPLLKVLDRLLRKAMAQAEERFGRTPASDPYRGLYLSEEEVEESLRREPGEVTYLSGKHDDPTAELARSSRGLTHLAREFGLEPFDLALVAIALAPSVDLRYERAYAYLQDDVTRRRPTLDLALDLLCASPEDKRDRRAHVSASSPLVAGGLLRLVDPPQGNSGGLLASELHLARPVANFLVGAPHPDPRLTPILLGDPPEEAFSALPAWKRNRMARLLEEAQGWTRPLHLLFRGRPGAGRHATAAAVTRQVGLHLLAADLEAGPSQREASEELLELLFLEARLHRRVVYLNGGSLPSSSGDSVTSGKLRSLMERHPGCVILALPDDVGARRTPGGGCVTISFPAPRYRRRRAAWRRALRARATPPEPELTDLLADRFHLMPQEVAWASDEARAAQSLTRGPETREPLEQARLLAAARARAGEGLAAHARRVEAAFAWDDLVLPRDQKRQLREMGGRVAGRRQVLEEWGFRKKLSLGTGLNALFAGPSGTGKTMAAQVLARELSLDLYRIDLSQVVSKYIGETEKNLAGVFDAAERSQAILFFDEADALFGKRSEVKDSHDRYANIEISYLLQRMEEYEGVAVLATNLRQNMDEAFARRLAFHIHFPPPGEEDRIRIWRRVFPSEVPLGPDVDLEFMGRRFRITGGNIRNAALAASFLASTDGTAVGMRHLIQGVRREFQKLGKVCVQADFEPYYHLVSDAVDGGDER